MFSEYPTQEVDKSKISIPLPPGFSTVLSGFQCGDGSRPGPKLSGRNMVVAYGH